MRFKEMGFKEIVHMQKGEKLGRLGEVDLAIDKGTGMVHEMIIPKYRWLGFKKDESEAVIQWSAITKIGEDIILIDL